MEANTSLTALTPEKPRWYDTFLAALREYGNVTRAAKRARISRETAYAWRARDEEFAQAWQEALDLGVDGLEDEAKRRAFEGVKREKPIFYLGKKIGKEVETTYSDTLLIFLLKAHRPAIYRETLRSVNINLDADELASMTDAELDELERKLAGPR